jgi:integrase
MVRRGANEGNIYRRADSRWEARLNVGYRGGKRIRKSFYGRTRREVQVQLSAAQRELAQGLSPSDARVTVGRFLERWLNDAVRPAVRPSTLRSYEMHVRLYLVPDIGRLPLARLSPIEVQGMLNDRLKSGLSARTVHHIRAVLRRALNQAIRWGLISRNVATLVDGPRVERHHVRAISPSEARALLEAVTGDRLAALYTVALAVGLRQGEALGLSWDDVDFEGGSLTVRKALQRIDGALRLVEPKTTRSRRTVAMSSVVAAALRQHRTRQLAERLAAGAEWRDSGLVFTSSLGAAIDGSNVTHRLHRLLADAGLPQMRFHDLRHACASLLMAQGVHPRVVMETLGHSQIGLTMNTYSHVLPSLQRDAADRIGALLEEGGAGSL